MSWWSFWNNPSRLRRESLHQKIMNKHSVQVPGCMGDPYDRNQPARFEKWYKLPKKAHQLFWRVRKDRPVK